MVDNNNNNNNNDNNNNDDNNNNNNNNNNNIKIDWMESNLFCPLVMQLSLSVILKIFTSIRWKNTINA